MSRRLYHFMFLLLACLTFSTTTLAANTPLSAQEQEGLIHLRIEEKLARDVYVTLAKKYNARVFENISSSEQVHMDMVKTLLATYNIADPITNDSVGVFPEKTFQQLYDQFIADGSKSYRDALLVGKAIEELDIKDIDIWAAKTEKSDILFVYSNLRRGSENHLRAFNRNLSRAR